MAALLIFRSCLQWKVFQLNQTQLFDRIINTMGGQIEAKQDNNTCLSYWLSNTVTLLYLLQKNIKPSSGGNYNSRLRSPASRSASAQRPQLGTLANLQGLSSPGPEIHPHELCLGCVALIYTRSFSHQTHTGDSFCHHRVRHISSLCLLLRAGIRLQATYFCKDLRETSKAMELGASRQTGFAGSFMDGQEIVCSWLVCKVYIIR